MLLLTVCEQPRILGKLARVGSYESCARELRGARALMCVKVHSDHLYGKKF